MARFAPVVTTRRPAEVWFPALTLRDTARRQSTRTAPIRVFDRRKERTRSDRFHLAICQIVGKRLTYAELISKIGDACAN